MSEIASSLKAALADRYTIERELGAGGMATVYLAHDIKHDRGVAKAAAVDPPLRAAFSCCRSSLLDPVGEHTAICREQLCRLPRRCLPR